MANKQISNVPQLSLRSARTSAGLTLRALAQRAGTSHTTLSAYENGSKSPNLDTFLRVLGACGYAVDFELHPRIREANGMSRGEELEEVLMLAEQFPAKPLNFLAFPKFEMQG